VLGLVFCAVAFALAVPLRNYISQQTQLGEALSQEQQLRAQLVVLGRQKAALADPAFIESEAKRRLQYVKPGDTVYVVHAPALPSAKAPGPAKAPATAPWYAQMWATLSDPAATAAQ
jgi:cell division protein FtsB